MLSHTFPKKQKLLVYHLSICVLFLVIFTRIITMVQNQTIGFETKDPAYNATAFYKTNNLKGPIFNNFDIGSYLIYRLYPAEKVFVDGRPEAYPASFFQDVYIPMQESPDLFSTVSNKYGFNTIIFSHTDMTPWAQKFLSAIVKDKTWTTVYLDPTMIILVKNTPENKKSAETYGMDFDSLAYSNYDTSDIGSLLTSANFANVIQHPLLQEKTYKDVLSIDPTNCPVLYNLSQILQSKNDPTAVLYASKYSQTCVR